MSKSLSDRKAELDRSIRGFIVPIYSEIAANGGQRNLLSEDDFNKVAYGYACSECLAEFVTYMAVCPVCGHERNVEKDIENHPPKAWVEHLREVEEIERMERKAAPVVPRGIDEFMEDVKADPDIEQVQL